MKVETEELPNGKLRLIFSDFTERELMVLQAGARKAHCTPAAFLKRVLLEQAKKEVAKIESMR